MYKEALVLNNLMLGRGQVSTRTDNVVAAKLKKLNWAIDQADRSDGAIILSGRIFDKSSSFSDMAFIINKGILNHPRVFLMPDYESYLDGAQISDKSMLSIIASISPGKAMSERPLIINDGDGSYKVFAPRWNASEVIGEFSDATAFIFFDSHKKPCGCSATERGAIIAATSRSAILGDDDNKIGLGSAFRSSLEQRTASAYRFDMSDNILEIDLPQDAHVFKIELVEGRDRMAAIKQNVELSITDEFDPRKKERGANKKSFSGVLDSLYGKNKISKPAYDIIASMKSE